MLKCAKMSVNAIKSMPGAEVTKDGMQICQDFCNFRAVYKFQRIYQIKNEPFQHSIAI